MVHNCCKLRGCCSASKIRYTDTVFVTADKLPSMVTISISTVADQGVSLVPPIEDIDS